MVIFDNFVKDKKTTLILKNKNTWNDFPSYKTRFWLYLTRCYYAYKYLAGCFYNMEEHPIGDWNNICLSLMLYFFLQ